MISVHAISMIYELRALRSRLQEMLARPDDLFYAEDLKRAEYMHGLVDNLIKKVERTGEYIADLESQAQRPHEEA